MTSLAEEPRRLNWARLTEARSIGIFGIFLGCLAAWLALPPLTVRSPYVPVGVGLLGVFAGVWAVTRKGGKPAWGAIVVGLLGIALGVAATHSGEGNLTDVVIWSTLFAATLRYATPLTFAAMGGLFSERTGVVNIGLEGMMLMGAFWGIWGADKTGSWELGIVIAALSGMSLALVHAFFAINLRADQIVTGTAINFLALGITGYAYVDIYGDEGIPPGIPEIPDVNLGFVKDIPFVGSIFGDLNLMIWLSFVTVILAYVIIFRTPIGLRMRAVGEHPRAADTVGISVYGIRYAGVLVSGALAALGGAYLSLGFIHTFDQNLTGGRGFIALAAVIFGNWRPFGAFAATLLFGFSSALADRLPDYFSSGSQVPLFFNILPSVLTLIAVAGIIGRSTPPAADGRPYVKQ